MKKLLPKRKPERKPSEEDVTVRKSKRLTVKEAFTLVTVASSEFFVQHHYFIIIIVIFKLNRLKITK